MLKTIFIALFSFNMLFGNGTGNILTEITSKAPVRNTGTLEKLVVSNGSVAVNMDSNRFSGKRAFSNDLRFNIDQNSFFTAIAFNGELRGFLPGSMGILPQSATKLPAKLTESIQNLVFEQKEFGAENDLVIRDSQSGFVFFNIEGIEADYDGALRQLNIQSGRVYLSREFAENLGRSKDEDNYVGNITLNATMRPIEVQQIVDGEITSEELPKVPSPNAGSVPGPDVVVGDVFNLQQFGSSFGTQVGLALGTTSCNFGTVDLNWFVLPNNDHPTIPQNLYRMSGGATNDERFEQIGQSQVKHAFTALTQNLCNLGCNGTGGSRLGSGCSDPYSSGLNSGPNLGARAWINPFTGDFPRGDSSTPPNNHTNHVHNGPTHRILTEMSDLIPAQNPGATYYAEGQYVTRHEYDWCATNPTQCNMYNNVSYRRYNVTNSASPFTFSPVGETVRLKTAVEAWTGALINRVEPSPGQDGIAFVAYKVTNPSPGVWHYEYAIYNQNLDRAIQSFTVPLGGGVSLSNIGFHAPPQHPGSTFDGTMNNAGFSSAPWTTTRNANLTWQTQTFAQNPNANAIRWGTLYNFRFDSNRPPENVDATIGFFKTGNPINVKVAAPSCLPTARCAGVRSDD